MSEQFRVIYASLAEGIEKAQASEALRSKLKLSEQQCNAFFNKSPLFAPSDKTKALKQAKAFAAMGIQTRLVSQNQNNTEAPDRDEQILTALDYITSSLIRLEEKLDDLESRMLESSDETLKEDADEEWAEELPLEEELDIPVVKRSKLPLILLGSVILVLLILLAAILAFPELLTF